MFSTRWSLSFLCYDLNEPIQVHIIHIFPQDATESHITEVPTTSTTLARKTARLELCNEFKLHGNITSIGVIRTSTSVGLLGMDSLLLSFKDAKVRSPQ